MGVSAAGVEKTLPMTVANTGFMLDRLGRDCTPLQFLRELTQNAIEAILSTSGKRGELVWDVDWDRYDLTGVYKLGITDNGVGMTGEDQVKYVNRLSSSVHLQSHEGNFGVGAKIAAATRNHEGLIYLSWKDDVGTMTHLWRDPDTGEYGLRQLPRPDGSFAHWGVVENTLKPTIINSHGTKVVLLGDGPDQNTIEPPPTAASPTKWIRRYLNTRYFRFPEGIAVKVREGWDQPRTNTDLNVLRQVTGQRAYLEQHAMTSGVVSLTGGRAHWWILNDDASLHGNSGFVASRGHMAALFQDELYELVEARAGVARLQMFGVVFGYQRAVIYVEPENGTGKREVTSNTARTHLIIDGEPLPWADWAAEFRDKMPEEIKALIDEVAADAVSSDHKESIKDRLRRIMELFKFSRYRPAEKGATFVDTENLSRGARETANQSETSPNGGRSSRGSRAGDVYALFLKAGGAPADAANSDPTPEVYWVSVQNGSRVPGVIEDRAARYLPEQNTLHINEEFRAFTDMIERYTKIYGDTPGARQTIVDVVQEWFEQQLIETVLGIQSLKDSKEWTIQDIGHAWSEEALTSAVMPRYHVDLAIKRTLGSKLGAIKEKTG